MTPSTTADPGLRFASSRLRKLERVSGQNAVEKRAITHLQTRDGRNLCKFSLTCCLEKFGKYRADITKLISAGALPITVLRVSIRYSAWRKGVTA